jgi:hypothetical protein
MKGPRFIIVIAVEQRRPENSNSQGITLLIGSLLSGLTIFEFPALSILGCRRILTEHEPTILWIHFFNILFNDEGRVC